MNEITTRERKKLGEGPIDIDAREIPFPGTKNFMVRRSDGKWEKDWSIINSDNQTVVVSKEEGKDRLQKKIKLSDFRAGCKMFDVYKYLDADLKNAEKDYKNKFNEARVFKAGEKDKESLALKEKAQDLKQTLENLEKGNYGEARGFLQVKLRELELNLQHREKINKDNLKGIVEELQGLKEDIMALLLKDKLKGALSRVDLHEQREKENRELKRDQERIKSLIEFLQEQIEKERQNIN